MKTIICLSISLLFIGCKKESYNCDQSNADLLVLCTQKNDIDIKMTVWENQLKNSTGARREYLIAQIEEGGRTKAGLNAKLFNLYQEMKANGCPNKVSDDCLK